MANIEARIAGCNSLIQVDTTANYGSTLTDRVHSSKKDFESFVREGKQPVVRKWCPINEERLGDRKKTSVILSNPNVSLTGLHDQFISVDEYTGRQVADLPGIVQAFFSNTLTCSLWDTRECPMYQPPTE